MALTPTTAAIASIAAAKRLVVSAWRFLIGATLKLAAAYVNNKNQPGALG
jgi:hypothetical protein